MDILVPAALIKLPKVGDSAILVEKKSQTLTVYTFSSPHREDGILGNAPEIASPNSPYPFMEMRSEDEVNRQDIQDRFLDVATKGGRISHDPMPKEFYEKVFETNCSTGEAAGRKLVEGDKKTPEGIYFIKKIFEDRYLTPIYGKRAFTTDYPNMLDQKLGRTGSAIWIHGTNRPLVPMDSNGCVAMKNRDVVVLDRYIQPDHTPIILANTLQYCTVDEMASQREVLLNFISRWCETMNHGDFGALLKFYGDDLPPDGVTWTKWQRLRQWNRPQSQGEEENDQSAVFISLSAENVGIYQQVNQLIVLFDLVLTMHDRQSAKASLTVGKRKWFLDNCHVKSHDAASSEKTQPHDCEDFYLNESRCQIIADGYPVLSISVKRGEDPLIAGANKLRRVR